MSQVEQLTGYCEVKMSNPFGADTVDDYGTLSGHGRGFRARGTVAGTYSLSVCPFLVSKFVI